MSQSLFVSPLHTRCTDSAASAVAAGCGVSCCVAGPPVASPGLWPATLACVRVAQDAGGHWRQHEHYLRKQPRRLPGAVRGELSNCSQQLFCVSRSCKHCQRETSPAGLPAVSAEVERGGSPGCVFLCIVFSSKVAALPRKPDEHPLNHTCRTASCGARTRPPQSGWLRRGRRRTSRWR